MGHNRSDPDRLSRSQVLTKYGIAFQTYETLKKSGFLKGDVTYGGGREFIEASEHNDFVFRAARNDIFSFGSKHRSIGITMPFHRFLTLRFLNTPASEVLEELIQIGLVPLTMKFRRAEINRYYSLFIQHLPDEFEKAVVSGNEPRKPGLKSKFRVLLKLLGIETYYDHPELISQLTYIIKSREMVEPFLSTNATSDEIAGLYGKVLHLKDMIPVEAIIAYRTLFYSIHELPKADLDAYSLLLPPDERRMRFMARKQSLSEYGARQGIDSAADTRAVLEVIKKDAQVAYLANKQWNTTDLGLQAMRAHLDIFFKASDRLDTLGGTASSAVAKMFEKFVVDPIEDDIDLDIPPPESPPLIEDKSKVKDKP